MLRKNRKNRSRVRRDPDRPEAGAGLEAEALGFETIDEAVREELEAETDVDRKPRRRKRRKIGLLQIVVIVLCVSFVVALGLSVKNLIDLKREHSRLEQQNEQLTQRKKALQKEFKHVNDRNYIERQARKQLKLVKPGETLYIVEDDEDSGSGGSGGSGSGSGASK